MSKSPIKSGAKSPRKTDGARAINTISATSKEKFSTLEQNAKEETNKIEIEIDANGLGISIVGGSDTPLVRFFDFYVANHSPLIIASSSDGHWKYIVNDILLGASNCSRSISRRCCWKGWPSKTRGQN